MFSKIVSELRYSDTFYQRMMLALLCTLYGLAAHNWLGAIFVIVGAAAWWRIFDKRPRVFIGTCVNIAVAVLWLSLCSYNLFVHGDTLADNVGEIGLCITSLFVLTRTDLTSVDKGTA